MEKTYAARGEACGAGATPVARGRSGVAAYGVACAPLRQDGSVPRAGPRKLECSDPRQLREPPVDRKVTGIEPRGLVAHFVERRLDDALGIYWVAQDCEREVAEVGPVAAGQLPQRALIPGGYALQEGDV